jgi:hypothetical protein
MNTVNGFTSPGKDETMTHLNSRNPAVTRNNSLCPDDL